jgi:hypothetical protein
MDVLSDKEVIYCLFVIGKVEIVIGQSKIMP